MCAVHLNGLNKMELTLPLANNLLENFNIHSLAGWCNDALCKFLLTIGVFASPHNIVWSDARPTEWLVELINGICSVIAFSFDVREVNAFANSSTGFRFSNGQSFATLLAS